MRRRNFIRFLGGAAATAASSVVLGAQPNAIPVIGFLNGEFASHVLPFAAAFREGLKTVGYVEGENVAIKFRYAEGNRANLPSIAADLARSDVAIIVTTGGTPVTLAAKAATTTIPIVFAIGGDPVQLGVVASLNRPGGNATGACYFFNSLGPKRLEFLHELVPAAKTVGYLINPTNPSIASETRDMQDAARELMLDLRIQTASDERQIEMAFTDFVRQGVQALIVAADVFFTIHSEQLVSLASRAALPASFHTNEIVAVGGLTSYGPNQKESYRLAGVYAGRILKGEKPADLPVVQATKFELSINLKTAKALGLEVPATLLGRADEVIE
jgi:putative ABC transport system substrate-binding protein